MSGQTARLPEPAVPATPVRPRPGPGPGLAGATGTGLPSSPVGPEEVTITLDGRTVRAKKGELLINVAERAGTYVPRFCYHPRMKPVGICRACLVEVKGPRGFVHQPACYTPVQDGMEVLARSERARKAQDGVLEFLLINHPLDCPVWDRGGECPLQDQTLAYGPGETRFVEEKRHWDKPIAISPLILLDRERCIQCARCTRFAEEVAGDPGIDFFSRSDSVEVAPYPDQPFGSNFSGNVVQVCPVGALLAQPYRFRAGLGTWRKWRRPIPSAPWAAGWRPSRAPTGSSVSSASTVAQSTGGGCATRGGSASRPSTTLAGSPTRSSAGLGGGARWAGPRHWPKWRPG